jgi:hypothetical protein
MSVKFRFLSLLVLLGFVLTYLSCKKTDLLSQTSISSDAFIETKFFNSNRSNDPTEKTLVDYLKRQNDKTNFVPATIKQIGFPVWDKAISFKNNKKNTSSFAASGDSTLSETYFIPFVRDSQNYVNATLIIETSNSDTSFQFKSDWQYAQMQNSHNSLGDTAENFAVLIMNLDKNVFGYNKFTILDSNLFKQNNKKALFVKLDTSSQNSGSNLMNTDCLDATITWNTCPYTPGNCSGPNGTCDNCPDYCTSSIHWTYCPPSGSPGDGGVPSGGPWGGPSGNPPPTGSGGWAPAPTPIITNSAILYLVTNMGLNSNESAWFTSSIQKTLRATEIQNYLIQHNNSSDAIAFCWLHLNLMMSDPLYFNFVNTHPSDIQTAYYAYLTEVENNLVNNSCLKSVTNAITKAKLQTLVYDLFKKEQATAASAKPKFKIKFNFEEVTSLTDNAPAATQDGYTYSSPTTISGAVMIIKLNTTALAGKSKEWITSVILHELCHAIKKAIAVNASFPNPPIAPTQAEEHSSMILTKAPLYIYSNLMLIFPNATDATPLEIATKNSDMKDLSIGSFADVLFSNDTLSNNFLKLQIRDTNYFPGINISKAYDSIIPAYKNLTNGKGTICN